jgi:hypothetical protein
MYYHSYVETARDQAYIARRLAVQNNTSVDVTISSLQIM